MDWVSIAKLLAERSDQPVAVLDRNGRIVLLNQRMEQALGYRCEDASGKHWWKAFVPSPLSAATERWFGQAMRGSAHFHNSEVLTRDGHRLLLHLEGTPVHRGRARGLLLTVRRAIAIDSARAPIDSGELDYEVTSHVLDFGSLRRVVRAGKLISLEGDGPHHCFRLLHQRDSPCEDCPVLRDSRGSWPKTTVREISARSNGFEVVTAEPIDTTAMRLSVRFIPNRVLNMISEANVKAIADKAKLSERERDILGYLIMGRSLDDIALVVGLSRSTVKFHQANILSKLGADSRFDLMRVLGF
jgi:PAS domain S-box-containing protein